MRRMLYPEGPETKTEERNRIKLEEFDRRMDAKWRAENPQQAAEQDNGAIGGLFVFVGMAAALLFAYLDVLSGFRQAALWINANVPFPAVASAVLALVIGYILYSVREVVKHRLYPAAEVFGGTLIASYGFLHQDQYLAGLIAFIAGVRIVKKRVL